MLYKIEKDNCNGETPSKVLSYYIFSIICLILMTEFVHINLDKLTLFAFSLTLLWIPMRFFLLKQVADENDIIQDEYLAIKTMYDFNSSEAMRAKEMFEIRQTLLGWTKDYLSNGLYAGIAVVGYLAAYLAPSMLKTFILLLMSYSFIWNYIRAYNFYYSVYYGNRH